MYFDLTELGQNWGIWIDSLNGGWSDFNFSVSESPVPEPSSYALLLGFLVGGMVVARRRR